MNNTSPAQTRIGLWRGNIVNKVGFFFLLVFCSSNLFAGNFLTNGDFETGNVSSWTVSGNIAKFSVGISTKIGIYSGGFSSTSSVAGLRKVYTYNVPVTAGNKYNLSGYVFNSTGAAITYLGLGIMPGGGAGTSFNVSNSTQTNTSSNSWQFISRSTTIASGVTEISVVNGIYIASKIQTPSTGYFDNIYFGQPDPPTILTQYAGTSQILSGDLTNSSIIITSFTQLGSVKGTDSSSAVRFHLQVTSSSTGLTLNSSADAPDWTNLYINYVSSFISEGTTGYQWPNLTDKATYWWRVWSEDCYYGVTGTTSTILSSGSAAKFCFDNLLPNQISDLTAFTGNDEGEVILRWTSPGNDGAFGDIENGEYSIKYSTNPIGNDIDFSNVSSIYEIRKATNTIAQQPYSSVITGLNPGTTYYFALKYRDVIPSNWASWSTGNFTNVNSVASSRDLQPIAPTGLSPVVYEGKITLSWDDVSTPDFDFYKIYCDSQTDNFTNQFSSITTVNTSIIISGLKSEVTYYFRITAIDKGEQGSGFYSIAKESDFSDIVSAIIIISPPVLTSAVYSDNNVVLSWLQSPDYGKNNFFSYNVYRSTVSGSSFLFIGSTSTGTSYVDSPQEQQIYYYILKTLDIIGSESISSNEKEVNADTIPPSVIHTPITGINELGGYIIFMATITDLVSANLYYQKTGGSWIEISTKSVLNDMYIFEVGPIDNSFLNSFSYYIKAQDDIGNCGYFYVNGSSITESNPAIIEVNIKTDDEVITSTDTVVTSTNVATTPTETVTTSTNTVVTSIEIVTTSINEIITSTGNVVSIPNSYSKYEAKILVPEGALDIDLPVTIEQKGYAGQRGGPGIELPALAQQNKLNNSIDVSISSVAIVCFSCKPEFLKFKKPVQLTLKYPDDNDDGLVDGTNGIQEVNLGVYFWDNWEWCYVGGSVDTAKNTVTVNIDHFTDYALFSKGVLPVKPSAKEKFLTPATLDGKNDFVQFECESAIEKIEIFNITGKKIRTINNGSDNWNGTNEDGNIVESGVYIYKVKAFNGENNTGAVVVAK